MSDIKNHKTPFKFIIQPALQFSLGTTNTNIL